MKMKILLTFILLFTSLNAVTLHTDKNNYLSTEIMEVTFTDMQGSDTDWIGLYPVGASYEWENVVAWKLTNGVVSGSLVFDNLPIGSYDVRAFFNNSLSKEAEVTVNIAEDPNYHPVSLSTDKSTYLNTESIHLSFNHMKGTSTDWIGLYPTGASYEFANVVVWKATGGLVTGSVTFDNVPAGEYDVRAFFENTLSKEAEVTIIVTEDPNHHDVALSTNKSVYLTSETIDVAFNYMKGTSTDWVGVYPAGATYDFENVVAWKLTNGDVSGSVNFDNLPAGSYDVRAFFENTLSKEAEVTITVNQDPAHLPVSLSVNREVFANDELIFINYDHMQGNETDWIGIYPAGSSYEFENVVDWKSTHGEVKGELSLGGLALGSYEVRAFFNNSLSKEAVLSFSVENKPVVSTIYEDAESGPSDSWIHIKGKYDPLVTDTPNIVGAPEGSTKTLVLVPEGGGSVQRSEYALPMNNTTLKVLEADIGGLPDYKLVNHSRKGYIIHYAMGVDVETTNGPRRMRWYSYLNHISVEAHIEGEGDNKWLFYPSPVETTSGYYQPIEKWNHFRVNIEKALRELEPNNRLIEINEFVATGGFLDNIKLSSH